MRSFFALGVLIIISLPVFSSNIDSLYDAAKSNKSLAIAKEVLGIAQTTTDVAYLAKAHFLVAFYQEQNNMYYDALNSYLYALKYYRVSENIKRQYITLINIALIFEKAYFFKEALELYDEAELLAYKSKDTLTTGKINYHKAVLSRQAENFDEAESLYQKALVEFRAVNNTYYINQIMVELGMLEQARGNTDKAINYFSREITRLGEDVRNTHAMRQEINLGYLLLNHYSLLDSAHAMFNRAIGYAHDIQLQKETNELLSKAYNFKANIFEQTNQPDSAIAMYEKALQFLNKEDLSKYYLQLLKKVADHYMVSDKSKAQFYQDEIYTFAKELAEVQQKFSESFIRYQVEAANYKHESEQRREAQLKQYYVSRIIYTAFIVFIVAAAVMLYVQRRRKRQRARQLLERLNLA